jgi:hypothetical protein
MMRQITYFLHALVILLCFAWIVYPGERTISQHLPGEVSHFFHDSSTIRIEPKMPGLDDVIHIKVFGDSNDVCVPRYRSHQVIENIIRIEADVPSFTDICLPVVLPWGFEVLVGPLPKDGYTVELYYVEREGEPFLVNTATFVVPTVTQISMPVIRLDRD